MEREDIYRNLVILLKMFKNRPYHLAKYLLENSALTEEFIESVCRSGKLPELKSEGEGSSKNLPVIYFADISSMNEYYESLFEEKRTRTPEEIEDYLNEKLDRFLIEEKYEEAARLRDYMRRSKINRRI
jgi:hypothetical protein